MLRFSVVTDVLAFAITYDLLKGNRTRLHAAFSDDAR